MENVDNSKECSTFRQNLPEDSFENIEDGTFLVQEDVITKTLQIFEYFDSRFYFDYDANGLDGSRKEKHTESNMEDNNGKHSDINGNSHSHKYKSRHKNKNDNNYGYDFNPDHSNDNDKIKIKKNLIPRSTKAHLLTDNLSTRPDGRAFRLFLQALSISYNKNKKEELENVLNNNSSVSRVISDVTLPSALLSSSSSSSPTLTSSLSSTLASTTSRVPSSSSSSSIQPGGGTSNAFVSSTFTTISPVIAPSLLDKQHPSGLQPTVSSDLTTALASEILQNTLQRHLDELDLDGVSAAVAQGAIIHPSHIRQAAKHFGDEHIPLFSLLLSCGEVYIADRYVLSKVDCIVD